MTFNLRSLTYLAILLACALPTFSAPIEDNRADVDLSRHYPRRHFPREERVRAAAEGPAPRIGIPGKGALRKPPPPPKSRSLKFPTKSKSVHASTPTTHTSASMSQRPTFEPSASAKLSMAPSPTSAHEKPTFSVVLSTGKSSKPTLLQKPTSVSVGRSSSLFLIPTSVTDNPGSESQKPTSVTNPSSSLSTGSITDNTTPSGQSFTVPTPTTEPGFGDHCHCLHAAGSSPDLGA